MAWAEKWKRVLQLLLIYSKIVSYSGGVKFHNRFRGQVLQDDVRGNGILRSGEMAMSSGDSVIVCGILASFHQTKSEY